MKKKNQSTKWEKYLQTRYKPWKDVNPEKINFSLVLEEEETSEYHCVIRLIWEVEKLTMKERQSFFFFTFRKYSLLDEGYCKWENVILSQEELVLRKAECLPVIHEKATLQNSQSLKLARYNLLFHMQWLLPSCIYRYFLYYKFKVIISINWEMQNLLEVNEVARCMYWREGRTILKEKLKLAYMHFY